MAAPTTVRTDVHAVTICAADTPHRMRVVGYLRGPRPPGMDCESPLRVVCRACDHHAAWSCQGHRESKCRPCAARYRRRVRAVAHSGMGREAGYLYLLTLTAPGDRAHSYGRGPGRQLCRCTPAGGVDLGEWNATHSRRWNHFRTRVKAKYEGLQFFRGVEVQQRGALHDHAMVWSPVPLDPRWLREVAMDAGFGHELDLAPCVPGSKRAAYYVSKYVTKATDARESVPWATDYVDVETGEMSRGDGPGRYRTWSMSREWGATMADVRARAAAYAAWKREQAAEAAGETAALETLAAVLGPCATVDDSGG